MDTYLVIYTRKIIYDYLIISSDRVIDYTKTHQKYHDFSERASTKITVVPMNKKGFSAYTASGYVTLMKNSSVYRLSALKLLNDLISQIISTDSKPIVLMKLKMPQRQFLDYTWNNIITTMVLERREINYAMSWLSTLGGAFSAMGDQFCHCAHIAGKISIHQFKLALRLDDPSLIARCKLYVCLSLIQQLKYDWPRKIIPEIYEYSITSKDVCLGRMCQGIWAKLKYVYRLKKKSKTKN
ncbi:uncharacterized protein F58A4.6 [Microplitis mediator]|uniref:uncharacterized protein F58A4.6 n=1 Tax=Microplitis mediator TaxID=375433 RepID=UPI002557942D|nr:uncharacterized protein F58A4.6 [Microplitis mediator]